MGAAGKEDEPKKQALIFTYGTLKMGFSNHGLLENMFASGDASYLGPHTTLEKFPLLCGPFKVPFLLNFPGSGHRVSGELYAVSPVALARMDELEGTAKGHYERLPVEVGPDREGEGEKKGVIRAEAYFAHRSYAEEMWRRGHEGAFLGRYTEKEAEGYVKRADRPQGVSFLDQIRLFVSSPSSSSHGSGLELNSSNGD